MASSNESEQLALEWINGWIAGKPDDIPLSSDFRHTSPFGTIQGRDDYLDTVRPMAAKNVVSLNIIRTLAGKDEAVIWFEMTTPHGPVPVCDWVKTADGQIVAITSFYDATDLRAEQSSY